MYLYAFLPFHGTFEKGEISESLLRHHFLVKKLFFDFFFLTEFRVLGKQESKKNVSLRIFENLAISRERLFSSAINQLVWSKKIQITCSI